MASSGCIIVLSSCGTELSGIVTWQTDHQIIKLYFSDGESENNLILELEEENRKLQKEANESQYQLLKFQNENSRLKEQSIESQSQWLKFQNENTGVHNILMVC